MTPEEIKETREKIAAGIRLAVAEALEAHRQAGRKIAIWQDGRVVVLTVEEVRRAAGKQED